jgi:prepilin-type N-terminal cleavage/methylation domain-containing protein
MTVLLPMRRTATHGFTLIELVLVVAIIAIAAGIVTVGITRTKERQSISQELRLLRAAIERTRSLTVIAGSRVGTARITHNGCDVTTDANGNPQLVMRIRQTNAYNYPDSVTPDPPNDQLIVNCRTTQLGFYASGGTRGEFRATAGLGADLDLWFSPTGRLLGVMNGGAPVVPADAYVRLVHTDPNEPPPAGLRVLPSGIVCNSSNPTPTLARSGVCDED